MKDRKRILINYRMKQVEQAAEEGLANSLRFFASCLSAGPLCVKNNKFKGIYLDFS